MKLTWQYGRLIYQFNRPIMGYTAALEWHQFDGASWYKLFSVDDKGIRKTILEFRIPDQMWQDAVI